MAKQKKEEDSNWGCGCFIYETIVGLILFIIIGICNGGFSLDSSFWIQYAKWKYILLGVPVALLIAAALLYLLWEKFTNKSNEE